MKKITDKMRMDWLQGRSVRVAWREDSIPNLLVHENDGNLRYLIDERLKEDLRQSN